MPLCDVVLVEGKGWGANLVRLGNWWVRINKRKNGIKFSHTGLMVDDGVIIEAIGKGITRRMFPYTKRYEIWRNKNFSAAQITDIFQRASMMVGKKYSRTQLFMNGFLKFLRIEKYINLPPPKGGTCSYLVAKSYVQHYRFKPEEDLELIDPADIADDIKIRKPDEWELIHCES